MFREIAKWTPVIDNPDRDNRLHSLTLSADGRRAYLAYLGGGFLVADTSDFAEGRPAPEVRLRSAVQLLECTPFAIPGVARPGTAAPWAASPPQRRPRRCWRTSTPGGP